jgi:hypothetical protein
VPSEPKKHRHVPGLANDAFISDPHSKSCTVFVPEYVILYRGDRVLGFCTGATGILVTRGEVVPNLSTTLNARNF